LDTPAIQERSSSDENGIRPLASHCFEGGCYFGAGVGVVDLNLQSLGARGRIHVLQLNFGKPRIGRIDKHSDTAGSG